MHAADHNGLHRRRAGILLHPTSLPGPFDNGVIGVDAERFVDFLRSSGFSVWQVLPLGPVDATLSPYGVKSVHAGNPRLIGLEFPEQTAWRPTAEELNEAKQWETRRHVLNATSDRFQRLASESERREFRSFSRRQRDWLLPFGLFRAIKERLGGTPWWTWPEPLRQKDPAALEQARRDNRKRIRQVAFEQYLFQIQWRRLKRYANDRDVHVFGDLPIYIDLDSVEVWWRPELFRINEAGQALTVAGVPPDYFSEDGQLWGNPIYDWDRMRREGFRWWIDRLRYQLTQFDLIRIDHFRALESYWEVPGDAKTARQGSWRTGPGAELLERIGAELGCFESLVAEDLGLITPAVRELRDRFNLPGMLVLQFAFDGFPDNLFLPEHHVEHAVVYTGTHDNDTTLGWYESLDSSTRERVNHRLQIVGGEMPDALVRAALQSPARLAIIPMQDLLRLGSEHRMNTPGTNTGNWGWRFRWEDTDAQLNSRWLDQVRASGRN